VVHSGSYALKMLNTSDSVVWYSGYVPIDSSTPYRVSLWARQTGDVTMRVDIDWYTSAKVAASAASASVTNAVCADDDTWENRTAVVAPGSDVAYAKLKITRPTSPGYDCYWDDITILKEPFSFKAYAPATTALTKGSFYTIDWGSEEYDHGANFASSKFTAPVNGLYQFECQILCTPASAFTFGDYAELYFNLTAVGGGTSTFGRTTAGATAGAVMTITSVATKELAAGETVETEFKPVGENVVLNATANYTWFSGRQLS